MIEEETIKFKMARFADIKAQIKALETEADVLNPVIVTFVEETNPVDGVVEVEGIGKFVMVKKAKYEFPEDVEVARNNLKEKEKESIAMGTAVNVGKPYLKFSPLNESENQNA